MIQIAQGAEAILYRDGETVVKDRFSKSYRHPELDKSLRGGRTRREAKVLDKLNTAGVPAPKLVRLDDENARLVMQHLDGPKLRDVLGQNQAKYAEAMGEIVGKLHANGLVHGDLTTSNMLLVDGKLHLIDFGLSQFSDKPEDKATDLKLMHRALQSKHHEIADDCWEIVLDAYEKSNPGSADVLKRLERVQQRGRNMQKPQKE